MHLPKGINFLIEIDAGGYVIVNVEHFLLHSHRAKISPTTSFGEKHEVSMFEHVFVEEYRIVKRLFFNKNKNLPLNN